MNTSRTNTIVAFFISIILVSVLCNDNRAYAGTEQALKALQDGNYKKAQIELASTPSPVNQYNMGVMYQYGKGVQKNLKEAVRYYKLAADQGLSEAMNNLGIMYLKGEGVPVDKKEAARYFSLADKKGNPQAQVNLGAMYLNGDGVKADRKRAKELFEQAAKKDVKEAKKMLEWMNQKPKITVTPVDQGNATKAVVGKDNKITITPQLQTTKPGPPVTIEPQKPIIPEVANPGKNEAQKPATVSPN